MCVTHPKVVESEAEGWKMAQWRLTPGNNYLVNLKGFHPSLVLFIINTGKWKKQVIGQFVRLPLVLNWAPSLFPTLNIASDFDTYFGHHVCAAASPPFCSVFSQHVGQLLSRLCITIKLFEDLTTMYKCKKKRLRHVGTCRITRYNWQFVRTQLESRA